MKTIYLTGFMGAGKTTVGIALSERLDIQAIDSDAVIAGNEKRTIASIFKVDGEDYFRQVETKVLFSLPTENCIVTTGGGIILKKENREFMKKNGLVIFLYCAPEKIFERLKDDTTRPLLTGDKKKEIESRLAIRLKLYEEAHYTIDTSQLTIDEIAAKILTFLD